MRRGRELGAVWLGVWLGERSHGTTATLSIPSLSRVEHSLLPWPPLPSDLRRSYYLPSRPLSDFPPPPFLFPHKQQPPARKYHYSALSQSAAQTKRHVGPEHCPSPSQRVLNILCPAVRGSIASRADSNIKCLPLPSHAPPLHSSLDQTDSDHGVY